MPVRIVKRREHFAALRVNPGRDGPRRRLCAGGSQRVERRDRHDLPPGRHRQALHRRDADAQPGERARTRGDGQEVDGLERDRRRRQDAHEVLWQPFAVVARRVAGDLADEHAAVDDGDASGPVRGVERED